MKHLFLSLVLTASILNPLLHHAQTQNEVPEVPYFTFGRGLGIISPDSLFLLNIRFRIQNRVAFTTQSANDWEIESVEARVRRMRLRFDGYIYTKRLSYVMQLSFSRGDMDFEDTAFPNVVRDAMVLYAVNNKFTIGLGQTKLPGNRQRVVSSGDLQLPDRSIVNATFNIDRDFGLQLYYTNHINGFYYLLRGALTSGEGRNITSSDKGLAYTGRIELLPFGLFTNFGDYFEGDLMREPKPKLSMGLTHSENYGAIRAGGQLGKFLYDSRDISTSIADLLIKYRGFAMAAELLYRTTDNPLTFSDTGDLRYVYKGFGETYQGSYLFHNNFEIAARFARVIPHNELQQYESETTHYTLGATKYLKGHRVKLQSDLTYETREWLLNANSNTDNFQIRFQIEIGI
ncbi:MAG TPA: porin [Cyclobacteriaceae bacterium]|nr:porin [Cyclobacteriaceae bacterium]